MAPITPRFSFRRHPVTRRTPTRRHLQAEVISETRDGVTARVLVEFTRDTLLPESLPETSDAIALDAVENALRTYLRSMRSPTLLRAGQRLRNLERLLETHEVIDHVFVITCDTVDGPSPVTAAGKARELAGR